MPLTPEEQQELNMLQAEESRAHQEKPGMIESAVRGAGQGLSLGYEDELRAAFLSKMGGDDKSYEEIRDEIREKNRMAQEENPWSYGAGNVVGGSATLAIPGLNVAKGASLGAGALKAAGLGAAAGFGASDKEDLGGQLTDTATGAALSGGMQFGIGALSKAAPAIGKGALNTAFGVSSDTSERYLANPEAVKMARPLTEIAEGIPNELNKVREVIPELSESATSLLKGTRSADKGIRLGQVIRELDDIISNSSDPSKLGVLQREKDNLLQAAMQRAGKVDESALADVLTEQEVKSVVKKLADQADFKNPIPSSDVAAINSASGRINKILKDTNPEYAAEVAKVSEKITLRDSLIRKYGLEKKPGGGYVSTDRTVSALKDLGRAGKMDRAKIAEELNSFTGTNLKDDVLNSLAKDSFDRDLTRGSKNVNLGGILGHAATARGAAGTAAGSLFGGPIGGAVGAVAGAAVDKYGGKAGQKILDMAVITKKLAATPGGQRFIEPLQFASQRGPAALSATYFLLGQSEPEFRKAMDGQESGGY